MVGVDAYEWAQNDPRLDAFCVTLAEGLPFGVEHAQSSAFALLERATGIRFEEAWLEAPHSRFDVSSPV